MDGTEDKLSWVVKLSSGQNVVVDGDAKLTLEYSDAVIVDIQHHSNPANASVAEPYHSYCGPDELKLHASSRRSGKIPGATARCDEYYSKELQMSSFAVQSNIIQAIVCESLSSPRKERYTQPNVMS